MCMCHKYSLRVIMVAYKGMVPKVKSQGQFFGGGAKSRKMFKLTTTIMLMFQKYYLGVVVYLYHGMVPKVKGQGQYFFGWG